MEQDQWKFDIKHVVNARCPICGAEAVMVKLSHRNGVVRCHTNGKRQETVEYACGYKVCYSPTFYREEIVVNCPNSLEELEKLELNKQSYEIACQSIKVIKLDRHASIKILKEVNCALGYPFKYDDPEKRFPDEDSDSGKEQR